MVSKTKGGAEKDSRAKTADQRVEKDSKSFADVTTDIVANANRRQQSTGWREAARPRRVERDSNPAGLRQQPSWVETATQLG